MTVYLVTTAVTAYESYYVEAADAAAAVAIVKDGVQRAGLRSSPDGDNDDMIVVSVREHTEG